MNSHDKKPFLDAMMAMGELYNRELSTTLESMYFDDLHEFDLQGVLESMRRHRLDGEAGRFFPKPSDIKAMIEGDNREKGMEAWPEVADLARNSRVAKSLDPITERVVQDMGGWKHFGMSDYKELVWMQKEFIDRYQSYSRRPDKIAIGRTNGPVLIGNMKFGVGE